MLGRWVGHASRAGSIEQSARAGSIEHSLYWDRLCVGNLGFAGRQVSEASCALFVHVGCRLEALALAAKTAMVQIMQGDK